MTATVEDYDWSDVAEQAEVRDSNTLPRTGTSRSSGPRKPGSPRRSKRLDDLQKSLSREMFQAGGMIALGLPVTGTFICSESESFPAAIIEMARKRSDWIDALEKIGNIGPGVTIGRTVLGIAAAMGTDRFHRTNGQSGFDPDKRACQFLGVTAAYYAVHKDDDDATSPGYSPAPHGVFQPVA